MIIISFILFVLIFAEHMIYIKYINNKKYDTLSKNNLDKLKQDKYINTDNNAVRLLLYIMNHPVFHI